MIWVTMSTRDNLTTNTLEEAVRAATYQSRDNASRVSRATFVINKTKFNDVLQNANIKDLDGRKLSGDDYQVSYLVDSGAEKRLTNNDLSTFRGNNEVPIKAVRVTISNKLNTNQDGASNKYVATQVIQTNGTSNDEPNDLTED